jgi:anti-anti-sigma factor
MDMDIENVGSNIPVTVMRPHGAIDGSNFQELIDKAAQLYTGGMRRLLLDLGDVRFMSSAGLVALHKMVLLMRGEKSNPDESGWDAIHAIDRDQGGKQTAFKLLNPQPKVAKTLEMSAMDRLFDIFTDEQVALASFS